MACYYLEFELNLLPCLYFSIFPYIWVPKSLSQSAALLHRSFLSANYQPFRARITSGYFLLTSCWRSPWAFLHPHPLNKLQNPLKDKTPSKSCKEFELLKPCGAINVFHQIHPWFWTSQNLVFTWENSKFSEVSSTETKPASTFDIFPL